MVLVTQESLVQALRKCLESNSARFCKSERKNISTMLSVPQSMSLSQQNQCAWRENPNTWNSSLTIGSSVTQVTLAGRPSSIPCSRPSIKLWSEAAAWATSGQLLATVIGSPPTPSLNSLLPLRNNKVLIAHSVNTIQSIINIEEEYVSKKRCIRYKIE